jgi:hypothetical protein
VSESSGSVETVWWAAMPVCGVTGARLGRRLPHVHPEVTPRRARSLRTAHSVPAVWRCGFATLTGVAAGSVTGFGAALTVAQAGGLL